MERKVFRGIGAVIAAVETDRRFNVVARMRAMDPTNFRADRHIPIDLDRTPTRATSWRDVQIDDRGIDERGEFLGSAMFPTYLTGYHITTLGGYLGPRATEDLARGPLAGAVFLEDSYFNQHRAKIDPDDDRWPTSGLRSYQLTTIAYSDTDANNGCRKRRYAGFHARLLQWRSGSVGTIELVDLTGATMGTWDFDLGDPEQCDPNPPVAAGESALRPDSKPGSEGALFVELHRVARFQGTGPKLPIGLDG